MNTFEYTARNTVLNARNDIAPVSCEMQQLGTLLREERVVDAIPIGWVQDPMGEPDVPAGLLAAVTLPGCDAQVRCFIPREEMDRMDMSTPEHILFRGIRVTLFRGPDGQLRGSRKRAQERTAAALSDPANRDRTYTATVLYRSRNGYVVLVEDHHAFLSAEHVREGLGAETMMWQAGQTLQVRFGHIYSNGHMFVYAADMYPCFGELQPGMFLPCKVLDVRDKYVLVALTPNITATAYIPEYGTLKAGDVYGGRIAKCGRDEIGTYFVRVKLFPEARFSKSRVTRSATRPEATA